MGNLFNENMTSHEARLTLFSAVEGKSKEEIEKIKAEYFAVSDKITDRELELGRQGWLLG